MSRRRFSNLLAIAVIGLLALAGCQGKPQGPTGGKIEIEFWTLQLLGFQDTIQPLIDRYEKEHPNIDIKWVDVPFSEGEKRTLTAIMSPNVPDVVNLNPDFSATLASRNALLDMAEHIPAKAREGYLPVAWQAATLERPQGESFTFGLPWYITSSVSIPNRDLLMRANHAKPPWSYDDLLPFARLVREKTGGYAFMPNITESGNFLKELKKLGVTLYDAEGKADFATDRAVSHLAMYRELYKEGLIPAETLTEGHRAAIDRHQSGTLAMLLSGPNFLTIVEENAPEVFKGTAVAPQFPPESPVKDFSLMVLVIPSRSAHPKEAVDFALYMTNAQSQLALSQAAPVLPSVTEALKTPYFNQEESRDLLARARSLSAKQLLEAEEAYQIRPGQNQINEIINMQVQRALLGKATPQKALEEAQRRINAVITSR